MFIVAITIGFGIGYKIPKLNFKDRLQEVLGRSSVPKRDPLAPEHWKDRVDLFRELGGKPEIVMLGDSITEAGEWNELLPNLRSSNRGVSGDTLAGVQKRLDAVLKLSPSKVYVMIGINDVARGISPSTVLDETKAILMRIKQSGSESVYQAILYVGYPARDFTKDGVVKINHTIRLINSEMQRFCEESGTQFLDINPTLAPNGVLLSKYTNDGIHLRGAAYAEWAKHLQKDASPRLESNSRH